MLCKKWGKVVVFSTAPLLVTSTLSPAIMGEDEAGPENGVDSHGHVRSDRHQARHAFERELGAERRDKILWKRPTIGELYSLGELDLGPAREGDESRSVVAVRVDPFPLARVTRGSGSLQERVQRLLVLAAKVEQFPGL